MSRKMPLRLIQCDIPLTHFVDNICSMEEVLVKCARNAVRALERKHKLGFYGEISFSFGGPEHRSLWRDDNFIEKGAVVLRRKVPKWCTDSDYDDESNAELNLYYPLNLEELACVTVKVKVLDYEDCRFWPIGIADALMSGIVSRVMAFRDDSFMAHFYTAQDALRTQFGPEVFSKDEALELSRELGISESTMLHALDDLFIHGKLSFRAKAYVTAPPSSAPRSRRSYRFLTFA